MIALIILPLLCPDTVYFGERFYPKIVTQGVRIPGDTAFPTYFNVASANYWDLDAGRIEANQDSFPIIIPGPVPSVPSPSRLTIDIGSYTTSFKKLAGKGCITTIVSRTTVGIKELKKISFKNSWRKNVDLNGRIRK